MFWWVGGVVSFPTSCPGSLTNVLGHCRHVTTRRGIFLLDPSSTIRTVPCCPYHYVDFIACHNARVSPLLSSQQSMLTDQSRLHLPRRIRRLLLGTLLHLGS